MKTSKIKQSAEKIRSLDKKTKIILAAGLAGMGLILFSEFIPSKNKNVQSTAESAACYSDDETEQYKQQTEKELKEILEKIDGVGECEVMVTLEGTTEYIYAENLSEYTDTDGEKSSNKHENEVVMIEQDGTKQALVRKIVKPQITGAVIVCEGGGDLKVNERVIKAVKAALNLSSGKICVEGKINK